MAAPAFLPPAMLSRAPPSLQTSFAPQRNRTAPRVYATPILQQPRMISLPSFSNPWAKQDPSTKPNLNLLAGYSYLAHPEKNTGEDAFFIEGNAAGVFDGVSGAFETRGVDPRLYSQTLAALTRNMVRKYGPEGVVKAAIEASLGIDQVGASTACVVGMDEFGRLFGINLGDSGVRIVRGKRLIFRTKEQQHFFNCPYQLGTDSEDGLAMGQNVQQKLKSGDWVVLATDGLYDNVSDEEIVRRAADATDAMELAEQLGELASRRGVDDKFFSPFMMAAQKANVEWRGGKADDITVVALKVVDDENAPSVALLSTLPEDAPEGGGV